MSLDISIELAVFTAITNAKFARAIEFSSRIGKLMRRLPSLRGIQAFEAAARLGSLSAAADSLGITGSAVSHRIRGLESELGVHLLRRTPRGLILTDAGRRYRGAVEDAFAGLTQATTDLLGPALSRPLTISLTSEIGDRKSTRLNSSH